MNILLLILLGENRSINSSLAKEQTKAAVLIYQTRLFLNSNSSIYHLDLFPGKLTEAIFLVEDPEHA